MKVETQIRGNQNGKNPSIIDRFCSMLSPKKKPDQKPAPLLIPVLRSSSQSNDRFEEFKRIFHCLDEDGDGKISPSELQNCMRRSIGEELSSEDAEAIVQWTDSDGDGLLGFDDFIKLAEGEEEELGEEEEKINFLWEAFRVYVEMEGTEGCITPKSLSRALDQLGQSKTVEECRTMICRYDINGDGVICFEEFKIMMH